VLGDTLRFFRESLKKNLNRKLRLVLLVRIIQAPPKFQKTLLLKLVALLRSVQEEAFLVSDSLSWQKARRAASASGILQSYYFLCTLRTGQNLRRSVKELPIHYLPDSEMALRMIISQLVCGASGCVSHPKYKMTCWSNAVSRLDLFTRTFSPNALLPWISD
jgi:hypothetical protein